MVLIDTAGSISGGTALPTSSKDSTLQLSEETGLVMVKILFPSSLAIMTAIETFCHVALTIIHPFITWGTSI